MNKKTKKIVIPLSFIFAIIIVLVALSFTVFSLKKVEINFKTSHSQISLSDQEIIDGGQFGFGQSVFFHSKKDYISRIENLSPYINVVNIETVFPSIFVVHIAQRCEVYAFSSEGKTYITDENLRVLKIDENFLSEQNNAISVSISGSEEFSVKEGDYLQFENFIDIYSSLFECNRSLNEQQALIKEIFFKIEYDEEIKQNQLTAQLNLFSGQTVLIKNASYGLKYKLNTFLYVYSNLYSLIGKEIAQTGQVWSENLLDSCTILINNYYNYTQHDETECYYNIFPAS